MPYSPACQTLLGPDQVAIAITHGLLGCHLGVAFCDEMDAPKILHLAWHKSLHVDNYPSQNWLVSVIPMGRFAASQASALLAGMAESYGNVSSHLSYDYGINLFAGRGAVSINGTYQPGDDCDGFTCASIISEVFAKIGFQLVNLHTWENKAENVAWGNAILCLLKATKTPQEHVQKVAGNINGLRLRPEEVAAAAERDIGDWPIAYGDIQARANEIRSDVKQSCGNPPSADGHQGICRCILKYQEDLQSLEV